MRSPALLGKPQPSRRAPPSRRNKLSLVTNRAPGWASRLTSVLVLPANLPPMMQIPVSFQVQAAAWNGSQPLSMKSSFIMLRRERLTVFWRSRRAPGDETSTFLPGCERRKQFSSATPFASSTSRL